MDDGSQAAGADGVDEAFHETRAAQSARDDELAAGGEVRSGGRGEGVAVLREVKNIRRDDEVVGAGVVGGEVAPVERSRGHLARRVRVVMAVQARVGVHERERRLVSIRHRHRPRAEERAHETDRARAGAELEHVTPGDARREGSTPAGVGIVGTVGTAAGAAARARGREPRAE